MGNVGVALSVAYQRGDLSLARCQSVVLWFESGAIDGVSLALSRLMRPGCLPLRQPRHALGPAFPRDQPLNGFPHMLRNGRKVDPQTGRNLIVAVASSYQHQDLLLALREPRTAFGHRHAGIFTDGATLSVASTLAGG